MRNDLPAAACRLMASCPVHTHERKPPEVKPNLGNRNVKRGRALTVIFGKGGKARRVRIAGTTYESASNAARSLHKSTGKIYEWLRDGTARYA